MERASEGNERGFPVALLDVSTNHGIPGPKLTPSSKVCWCRRGEQEVETRREKKEEEIKEGATEGIDGIRKLEMLSPILSPVPRGEIIRRKGVPGVDLEIAAKKVNGPVGVTHHPNAFVLAYRT